MTRKHFILQYLTIVTVACALLITAFMLWGYWKIQQDDSFIFYSYANNILNGNGYVFNKGERINATTSPLYTILIFLLAWIFQPLSFITLPIIGHLIGAICLFVISILLLTTFKTRQYTLFPFVLPLVFLSSPLISNAIGMETSLTMMFAMSCLYLWWKNKLLAASLFCSLAVLTRPDMALLAVIVPIYDFIRHRRLPSISMLVLFLLPIFAWLIFSYFYFGELLPTTLSAKLGQTESGRWGTGLIFLRGLFSAKTWHGKIFMYPVFLLTISGIVVSILKFRQWEIFHHPVLHVIFLWNFAYLISYGFILNPPGYAWYYTPLSIGLAILVSLGIEAAYQYLKNKKATSDNIVVTAIFLLLLIISLALPLKIQSGNVSAKFEKYSLAADWLNANVEEDSSVAASEIGILRYFYTKGPVIDALGLVTPGVAEHVKKRDYSWYILRYKPDYLMFNQPHRRVLESMVETDWFKQDYHLQTLIKTPRKSVAIYKRQK